MIRNEDAVRHLLITPKDESIKMTFEEFKESFLKWTEENIESKKEDGFPICPFARKARLQNKIQFIDATSDIYESLELFDKSSFEIGIAWVGDEVNMRFVDYALDRLKHKNSDLLYFTSTTESGHFAKNFTNCVFIQLHDDIMEKRKYLHTTSYYENWPKWYYELITGNA